jgi:uncharacterized membrane protein (UPF0127 family)
VRVVHADRDAVLADAVDVADTVTERALGLMFRRRFPDGSALVFEFGGSARRVVHTVFVPFGIDVLWLVDGRVERIETLPAWRGLASARADRLMEVPAGVAAGVDQGDTVRVET